MSHVWYLIFKVMPGIYFRQQVCDDAQLGLTLKKTKKQNKKMKQLHAILSRCYFNMFILLFKLWRIKCVLLTMQSLFMIIDMLNYWFLSWCLCLSENVIYHQWNVEILQIGILYAWSQVNMHLTVTAKPCTIFFFFFFFTPIYIPCFTHSWTSDSTALVLKYV